MACRSRRWCCRRGRMPPPITVGNEAHDADGRLINSRFLDGLTVDEAKEEVARRLEGEHALPAAGRPAPGQFPPARLGHLAPALLGLPDPGDPLRDVRRGAGARRRSAGEAARRRHLRRAGQPARPPPDLEARRLPELRQAGAARNRHHGHLRRFVLVFRALHLAARDHTRPSARWSTAGCRSTSISAASSTRSCTCSIRASSPGR